MTLWGGVFEGDSGRGRKPEVLSTVGQFSISRGDVTVALTDNPIGSPDDFKAYVALARWRPRKQPVVMFITFAQSGDERRVNLVFRPEGLRHQAEVDGETSIAVQIGKWLFSEGHLTHHSPARTDAGDCWARQVGGELPPRDENGPASTRPTLTRQVALRAYEALCQTDWGDLMENRPYDDRHAT